MDCNQCWICNRWNKFEVQYHPNRDRNEFTKQVEGLDQMYTNVTSAVTHALREEGAFDEKIEVVKNLNELSDDEDECRKPLDKAITLETSVKAPQESNKAVTAKASQISKLMT